MKNMILTAAIALSCIACSQAVRLPPAQLAKACDNGPCGEVPNPIHGLEWDQVLVENAEGSGGTFPPDRAAFDALTAPEVECLEFRRDTKIPALVGLLLGATAGTGVGVGAGLLAGQSESVDKLGALVIGAGLGALAGSVAGAVVGHRIYGADAYPPNPCRD